MQFLLWFGYHSVWDGRIVTCGRGGRGCARASTSGPCAKLVDSKLAPEAMDDADEFGRRRRRSATPEDRGDKVGRRRPRSPSPSHRGGRDGPRRDERRGRSRSRSPHGKRRRYSRSPGRGYDRRGRDFEMHHRDRSPPGHMRERSPPPCGGAFRDLSYLVDFDTFVTKFQALPEKDVLEKDEMMAQARLEYAR